MDGSNNIVIVGSCMIDFVSYATRLPKEGETVRGHTFATNFGGKGANQCIGAAKLGGRTSMVARLGDDEWADKYLQNLRAFNVDTTHVRKTAGISSGIAQIAVSDQGANQIVIIPGANQKLDVDDVRNAQELISAAGVLVCQLETSQEAALAAIKFCKGISILNGAPALTEYPLELITSPTIFCVNESEGEVFSGHKIQSIDDGKAAIKTLLEKGCRSVVLTMGKDGAIYAHKNDPLKYLHVPSPQVKAVDTTGAGDVFIGALAFLLANRKDLAMEQVLAASCAIACDSVTRPGTQISYPGPEILNKVL